MAKTARSKSTKKASDPKVETTEDLPAETAVEAQDEPDAPAETAAAEQDDVTAETPDVPETQAVEVAPEVEKTEKHRASGIVAPVAASVAASAVVVAGLMWFAEPLGLISGNDDELNALQTRLESLAQENADLTAQVETLAAELDTKETAGTAAKLSGRIDGLSAEIDQTATALAQRLVDLENRPIPDIGATEDAVAAYEQQLASMRAMFAEELERIRAEQEKAMATQAIAFEQAANADVLRALGQVETALAAGTPFAGALETLAGHNADIPAALRDLADTGAPTREQILDAYSDAARLAIAAVDPAATEGGAAQKFLAYLKSQVNTRSLSPRDGDDVDAILSRAEDGIRKGNLAEALGEIDSLPPESAAHMTELRNKIQKRLDSVAAFRAMSSKLGG